MSDLNYGEKAVGYSFNPSGEPAVAWLKQKYAEIIQHCHEARANGASDERKRLWSIAITEAQAAQMWAVKAQTWQD
jgi:hypothetical protein